MIEIHGLTKHHGGRPVVNDLSFEVLPGVITGFLGPNGAGKSTTLRMILDIDQPTAGHATINHKRYRDLPVPLAEVGAVLDAHALHPRRSAIAHLRALARGNGLSVRRAEQTLELVGLADAAGRSPGTFSLGMRQRLAMAAALLGDPRVLILDEPLNGLDPEGVHWFRGLMREFAAEGRTVFVASHLMSEMQQLADRVVIVAHGQLIADESTATLRGAAVGTVQVRTPDRDALIKLLRTMGSPRQQIGTDPWLLTVTGLPARRIGEVTAAHGIVLHELVTQTESLEDTYLRLTDGQSEHQPRPPQQHNRSRRRRG